MGVRFWPTQTWIELWADMDILHNNLISKEYWRKGCPVKCIESYGEFCSFHKLLTTLITGWKFANWESNSILFLLRIGLDQSTDIYAGAMPTRLFQPLFLLTRMSLRERTRSDYN